MARGWESKSIEAQQAEALSSEIARRARPPADRARAAELATLTLARSRAQSDLQMATADAHRRMLERAIADLDRRIALLRA